jgi:hypothetical protein
MTSEKDTKSPGKRKPSLPVTLCLSVERQGVCYYFLWSVTLTGSESELVGTSILIV